MAQNLKRVRYKDLVDNKLNHTSENLNKELANLELALQQYAKDNAKLA
jgi:hypothetical protein